MTIFGKIFRFLASLKLAVILLLMLAGMLATATFYESVYDTKTAQHLVYRSPFFACFLCLLFVNIFCSTANRYPWKRHQFGFVITHLGILTLLTGSLVTMVSGVDGTLAIEEGKAGNRVSLDEPVFFYGRAADSLKEIPAEFRWNPPKEGSPATISLADDFKVVVDRYYHHSVPEPRYETDEQAGVGAVKLRIHNKRVDVKDWLTLARGDLKLGPATAKFLRLRDAEDVKAFEGSQWQAGDRGELQILIKQKPYRVPVRDLKMGEWMSVPQTDFEVRLKRYLAHAVVENNQLVSRSEEPVNPTLELEVREGPNSQSWLLFAKLIDLNTRTASVGKELPVRLLYDWDPQQKSSRSLCLAVGPDNSLYYSVDGRPGHPIKLNQEVATGWMDLKFELLDFVAKGREVKEFREIQVDHSKEAEGPPPAIRVHFPGITGAPGGTRSAALDHRGDQNYWLERGDVIQVPNAKGESYIFGYGYRTLDMGFNIRLKKFAMDYDPGTTSPSAFRSVVEVDGAEHTIQMNEPLDRNGYKFFQASYSEIDGQPKISVFTVARDPGITLKYVGSILLVSGIAIMFYMKPYQLRNRKRKVDGPESPDSASDDDSTEG